MVYIFTIASFIGMAYLEFRRGSRVALAYFGVGQLFAIFAQRPAPLALRLPALAVGAGRRRWPSTSARPGEPWRASPPPPDSSPRHGACARGLVLLGFIVVTLFFWGSLADLEHALAVGLVLFVDRSLRFQRTTVREQRLIAFVSVLAVLAIEVLTFLVPTDGPFGHTDATDGSLHRHRHRRRSSS